MTMSPMPKRITLLPVMIVAMVVAFASVACAQQVHLQVAIADPGKTPIGSLQEMVAEFERLHPNIKFTEHPDEAWEFIKWMYSREAQLEYVRRYGMQPVLLSLGYEWIEIVQERIRTSGHPPVPGVEAFITSSAFAMPQPFFANSAVIGQYIQPTVARIMTENVAIAPTLEAMVQSAEAFLRQQGD